MWRAAALGVVTGMRSQLPTALLVWRESRGQLPTRIAGPARVVAARGATGLMALLAGGEVIGDKLPWTPSRLDTGPFLGRLAYGASAGWAIAAATCRSRVLGGAFGLAGAAAGSVLGARYRAYAAERTDVPDVVWAVLEDAAAIAIGVAATRVPEPGIDGP